MQGRVLRHQYRAQLNGEPDIRAAMDRCGERLQKLLDGERLMTAGLFRYGSMLFAYYECVGESLPPESLFSAMTRHLLAWPGEEALRLWVPMNLVFYHCLPQDAKGWKREREPQSRRGRLAILHPGKLFSYVYHHVALTTEGLLTGDKYLCISLHENCLFAYTEEPRVTTNVRGEPDAVSAVIQGWREALPKSHFRKWPGSEDHFTDLETLLLLHD